MTSLTERIRRRFTMPKSGSELLTESDKPVFNILSQSLSMVCAFAAVEFDWIIQGKEGAHKDRSSVEKLLVLLSGLEETLKCRGYVDNVGLYRIALAHNSTTAARVNNLSELLPVVSNLVSLLRNPDKADKQDLIYMRTFLGKLSEEASKAREIIYGRRTRGHR